MLIIAHFLLKALSSSYMIMRYAIHEAWNQIHSLTHIQSHLITQFEASFLGSQIKRRNEMHATNWKWMNYIVAKVLNFEWLFFNMR